MHHIKYVTMSGKMGLMAQIEKIYQWNSPTVTMTGVNQRLCMLRKLDSVYCNRQCVNWTLYTVNGFVH